jgi:hypothetical protein
MNLSRRLCTTAIASSIFFVGCEAKEPVPPKGKNVSNAEAIEIDISTYSYIERPIFDIYSNKTTIGAAGGGSVIAGASVKLGPQVVTWRLDGPKGMARNGETVTAKNAPLLAPPPSTARYLGIHIYPDDTVEFIYSQYLPERTERGEALLKQQAEKK